MRRSQAIIFGVLALLLIGVIWWIAADRRLPVPSTLVGTWKNQTPIFAAGPGEVRLTVRRDGTAVAAFDHSKFDWWGTDQFSCVVRNGQLAIRIDPDKHFDPLPIEITSDRFCVYDHSNTQPSRREIVFSRVDRQ